MRTIASKQAELENSLALVESEVHRRTKKLLESNELINLQKQKLETSSKMSALGEISGGIAHEIKNPLAVIIGASEQAEKKILSNSWDPNDLKKQVGLIRRNAQRMSKIIDSLRRFSRNAAADPLDPVSASSIINDVLELLGDFAKSDDIRMESSLLFDFDFECRPSEIGQILLNLALNSRDAIATKENRWITIGAYRLADRVRFSVTDCGDGIEESIVEKLSQPFFSTKPKDKGTGLGLSISKKLAVDHGGLLYYDRTSKNTRFNLDLPLKKGEVITSTDEIDPAHAGECA